MMNFGDLKSYIRDVLLEYYSSNVAHKAQGDEKFTTDDVMDLVYMTLQAYVRNDSTSASVVPVVWESLKRGMSYDEKARSTYVSFKNKVSRLIKLEKILVGSDRPAVTIQDRTLTHVEDEANELMGIIEDEAELVSRRHVPTEHQKLPKTDVLQRNLHQQLQKTTPGIPTKKNV